MEIFSWKPSEDKRRSLESIDAQDEKFCTALKHSFGDRNFTLAQAIDVYQRTFGHGIKDDHVARALSRMNGIAYFPSDMGDEYAIIPERTH